MNSKPINKTRHKKAPVNTGAFYSLYSGSLCLLDSDTREYQLIANHRYSSGTAKSLQVVYHLS